MNSNLFRTEKQQRTFDFVSLQLSGNYGREYVGHGRLQWSSDEVLLTATTDGGENVLERMLQPVSVPPGELLPDDHYLKLAGRTQCGWTIRCERLSPENFNAVSGQPTLTWTFGPSEFLAGLELERNGSANSRPPVSRANTTGCELSRWPRFTEIETKNDAFGKSQSKHDWLQYECHLGLVSIQKVDEKRSRLRVDHAVGVDSLDTTAICAALSFISGRAIDLIAIEMGSPDQDRGWLRTRAGRVCATPYMGPFSHDSRLAAQYESAMACLTNLFTSDKGKHVAGLLYACINAADNNFTTQAMVLCATVESLADLYQQREVKSKDTDDRKTQLRGAKNAVVKLLTDMNLAESDVRRIEGLFSMLEATSAKSILNEFARTGWAQISSDEVVAWSRLRNKVMHGTLVLANAKPQKVQAEIQCQQLVANLINKIVLHVAGYRGWFFDYLCWDLRQFAPSEIGTGIDFP